MGGKQRRRKGGDFERKITRLIRSRFPGVEVHRSSQADRAYDADLVCTGHPALERCWLELTDGRAPNVKAKLEQAERDVDSVQASSYWGTGVDPKRLPVVVHHRLRERTTYATMRLQTLLRITTPSVLASKEAQLLLVTMSLDEWLEVLR